MAFALPLLPVIAAGAAVAGTAASALSAHNAAEFQAKLQAQQAAMASDQASVKASEVARGTKQTLAAARAGAIENGFDLSGSTVDLLDQAERTGNLDYLTAVYEGRVQSTGLQASSKMSKRAASNALIQGGIGMVSSALGGASSMYKAKANSIGVTGT